MSCEPFSTNDGSERGEQRREGGGRERESAFSLFPPSDEQERMSVVLLAVSLSLYNPLNPLQPFPLLSSSTPLPHLQLPPTPRRMASSPPMSSGMTENV
jgi:hypothetical protein